MKGCSESLGKKTQSSLVINCAGAQHCRCPGAGEGCRVTSVRSSPGLDMAGSRQLQGTHLRAQLSPAAMMAMPRGKHL